MAFKLIYYYSGGIMLIILPFSLKFIAFLPIRISSHIFFHNVVLATARFYCYHIWSATDLFSRVICGCNFKTVLDFVMTVSQLRSFLAYKCISAHCRFKNSYYSFLREVQAFSNMFYVEQSLLPVVGTVHHACWSSYDSNPTHWLSICW